MTSPLSLQYLQAGALIAIPAVGAWLAWQQVQIARVKLQHDLYDRRYRVFDATRRILANVCAKGHISNEDQRTFTIDTGDAIFLFDDDFAKYLGEEVKRHVTALLPVNLVLDDIYVEERRAEIVSEKLGHLKWLNEQLTGLADKIKPFLKLDKR
jgi:hypothetical protein